MNSWEIAALVAGTLFLAIYSWLVSIRHKRYHGIPRFFAFEGLFILLGMNYHVWFSDPFSFTHLLSWIFLIGSLLVAIIGFIQLHRRGRPKESFENTTKVVDTGIYKYIRHPLYLSLFMGGLGITLKSPLLYQWLLLGIVMLALFLTARIEEHEMIARFGDAYKDYRKRTKAFIPFIL